MTFRERVTLYRESGFERPVVWAIIETVAPVLLAVVIVALVWSSYG